MKISKVFIPKYEICDLDFYNVLDSFVIFASQNPKFSNSIFSSFEIDNKNNEFYFEVIGNHTYGNSEGYIEYKGFYFFLDTSNINPWLKKTNTKKMFNTIEYLDISQTSIDDAMTTCIYEYKNGKFYSTFKQLGNNGRVL